MAEVSRRHGELGQAAATYKQGIQHGTWEVTDNPDFTVA
jgi:hypothetical protein